MNKMHLKESICTKLLLTLSESSEWLRMFVLMLVTLPAFVVVMLRLFVLSVVILWSSSKHHLKQFSQVFLFKLSNAHRRVERDQMDGMELKRNYVRTGRTISIIYFATVSMLKLSIFYFPGIEASILGL